MVWDRHDLQCGGTEEASHWQACCPNGAAWYLRFPFLAMSSISHLHRQMQSIESPAESIRRKRGFRKRLRSLCMVDPVIEKCAEFAYRYHCRFGKYYGTGWTTEHDCLLLARFPRTIDFSAILHSAVLRTMLLYFRARFRSVTLLESNAAWLVFCCCFIRCALLVSFYCRTRSGETWKTSSFFSLQSPLLLYMLGTGLFFMNLCRSSILLNCSLFFRWSTLT